MLTILTGAAHAADRDTEMKARQAFASGHYDQALDLFAKLYAETLHPTYLRNIGRCHQKMREPQKAIDAFRDYLAKAKKVPADDRKETEGYIKEMEALRDEQAQAQKPVEPAPPPPVAPPPVPPPAYAYTQPPPGYAQAGLTTSPPPPEQQRSHAFYTRWWFWTAVGVVVVGGAVAAIALSSGSSRPTCTSDIMGGCK